MKLRVIGLMALLFAGSAVADEVYLNCGGTYERCDGGNPDNIYDKTCWEASWQQAFRINQESGTISASADLSEWEDAKSVEFTATEIKAEFKRSGNIFKRREQARANPLNMFKSDRDLTINRMTGLIDWDDRRGQCRVMEMDKQLF